MIETAYATLEFEVTLPDDEKEAEHTLDDFQDRLADLLTAFGISDTIVVEGSTQVLECWTEEES